MRRTEICHEFVEFVPSQLAERTLYVSIEYATAVHLCACGCGNKVVTPISPPEWQLIYDGDSVSLYPSIGNWQFPCQSHYWISRNKIKWARRWSKQQIEKERERDEHDLERYFTGTSGPFAVTTVPDPENRSVSGRVRRWIRRPRG